MTKQEEATRRRAGHCPTVARYISSGLMFGTALLLTGCVQPDRRVPVVELSSRILPPTTEPAPPRPGAPRGPIAAPAWQPDHPITLDEAIEIAYQESPVLRIAEEAIEEARAGKVIARSAFLPYAAAAYGYNWRDRQPGFITRSLPLHIRVESGEKQFQQAELHVQMTIWDFGRSLGRYEQARLGVDIAQLQYERLRETIAFQVTESYFAVLRGQKAHIIARDAVNQAESHLKTVRSFFRQGVVDKNDVLRAEVQVAETRQGLVSAGNAIEVTVAALNRVLGINVNHPTEIIDVESRPPFARPFVECLELAVENRREFQVVQKSVLSAQHGLSATQAEHLPRIFVGGSASHLEDDYQLEKTLLTGTVGIQIDLFTGGRRTGETQAARARVRSAIEMAKQVCDGIAFEVKQAHLAINEARERIVLSESAVAQAGENLRLINNKYAQTAATPTDVVDAETLVTRARQNYYAAVYDYLVALRRLDYAVGAAVSEWTSSALPSATEAADASTSEVSNANVLTQED